MHTILFVEDDEDIREVVSEILRSRGFRVHEARDGLEGLRVLSTLCEPPSVVLLDLMMPRLDGAGFLARARIESPELAVVPVVILTAAGVGSEKLVPPEAVDLVVSKPVGVRELVAAIETALRPERQAGRRSLRRRLLDYLSRSGDGIAQLRSVVARHDFASIGEISGRLGHAARVFGYGSLLVASEALRVASGKRDVEAVHRTLRELADALLGMQTSS